MRKILNNIKIKKREWGPALVIGIVFILLLFRNLWFVYNNAINLIFWDQWDFLTPIFNKSGNIWEIFSWQHGPHRQGLGGIIQAIIYPLTDWDVRYEIYLSVFLYSASAFLALLLKKRIWGGFTYSDIAIPLIYLSLLYYENFVAAVNIAHGPLPVFLISLSALAYSFQNNLIRLVLLTALVFLTTFTGFAIFSGLIVILVFFIEIFHIKNGKARWIYIYGILISFFFFYLFTIDYVFMSAVDCFEFPHSNLLEYPEFMIAQFGRVFGFVVPSSHSIFNVLMVSVFFTFLVVLFISGLQIIRKKDIASQIIFYLTSFTFLFIAFTALGRVCLGLSASMASRYVPYSLLGLLGMYFAILEYSKRPYTNSIFKTILLGVFILFLFFKERPIETDINVINWYRNGKNNWKECYLESQNISLCDSVTSFKVYPDEERIQKKMEYLKENRVSIFKESKKNQ